MAINALNPNSAQQFRPNSAPNQVQGPGQAQQNNNPALGRGNDQSGLSPEAQQAAGAQGAQNQGGGAQQLTAALAQGIGKVMQSQSSGDENAGQQALQQLGQTYQQGQQSGQLEQVNPTVRGMAESLLGVEKGEEGKKEGGGGGKCGGGGQPKEAGEKGGAEEAGKGEDKKFDDEFLKKLEQILGKDKADEAKKNGECDKGEKKGKCDKSDDKDAKSDSKVGDVKTDSKVDSKKSDSKVDSVGKTETKAPSKKASSPAPAAQASKPAAKAPKKAA